MLPEWEYTQLCRRNYKRTINRIGKGPINRILSSHIKLIVETLNESMFGTSRVDTFWPIEKRIRILSHSISNVSEGIIESTYKEILYKNSDDLQKGLKQEGKLIVQIACRFLFSFYEGKEWNKRMVDVFELLNDFDESLAKEITTEINGTLTNKVRLCERG
jgi:hypothetical protein